MLQQDSFVFRREQQFINSRPIVHSAKEIHAHYHVFASRYTRTFKLMNKTDG